MLSDDHIKVEKYVQNAEDVFPNTDIKGGVAVLYRDYQRNFGAIEEFIPDEILRGIAKKIRQSNSESITTIMHGGRSDLLLCDEALQDYPNIKEDRLLAIQRKNPKVKKLGPNEEKEIKSSSFDVTPYIFLRDISSDESEYYRILGLSNMKREWRYIKKKYVTIRNTKDNNIDLYKTFIPKASGTGKFGETLSKPITACPGDSSTPTFISIGQYKTKEEADNTVKYVCTKFARALLGILKITQDIVPSKWKYVPLQNFTSSSDIDWSESISDIDKQLYKKYDLSQDEIDFIETHVKEMA